MKRNRARPILIRHVNLLWYPVTLVPVIGLFLASAYGLVPGIVGPLALFLLFFWLFSFGFAVYAKLRKPKDPRQ